MKEGILREIIPMTQFDCYTINRRIKSNFDFPFHYHEELELNFIHNAKGAKRVIGEHIGEIEEWELVLVGSNLEHAWFDHKCNSDKIEEITLQFHKDLFDERFLRRNQLSFIKKLLEKSSKGILFSQETAKHIQPRLRELTTSTGFDSVLELLSILHDLSIARNSRTLSDRNFNTPDTYSYQSRRVERTMEYMHNNFSNPISLSDVAKIASMSEVAFSRFFKQRTGTNFIDGLTEIRLGHASRMLIDTTHSISEIAYSCGFNNISNFNRAFKRKKNCTPKEFRAEYNATGARTFV